jgi:hypothetical protein
MRGLGWKSVFCAAGLFVPLVAGISMAQEPTPPPSASAAPAPAATPSKPGKQKYSHGNDYLIRGTVFNEKALSFPGVQLRIRLAGEKKFRWESYTDSRGEFAVRVPQGSMYEMVVRRKGFEEQTRTIDAKNGGDADNIVFRMQPAEGGKK